MTKSTHDNAARETAAPTLKDVLLSAEPRTESLVPTRLKIRQRPVPQLVHVNSDGPE